MTKIETKKGALSVPCMETKLVPIEKVQANNYNPNNVADKEMELLETSIFANGMCFPVVTIYDDVLDKYIIIDGFHRYQIFVDIGANVLPIVVLEHDMTKRMEATVQFNRARGTHQTELMGDLVQALVEQGASDEEIAKHLGMEAEEVYRLKQVTGIAALFKNQAYSRSWQMTEVEDE